ncbi:hypothetical protein JCM39194_20220 [Desulfotomaculum varum]
MTEVEYLSLTEYLPVEFSRSRLTENEGLLLLEKFHNQVKVEFPSPATGGNWRLSNQGWVGYIRVSRRLFLYLRPRVELSNIFTMLEYAYRLKSFQLLDGLVECQSLQEFYERLARILARLVLERNRQGLYREYRDQADRMPYVSGQLDVRRQLIKPWEVSLPCRFQEYTSDIEDNQILTWTLNRILRSGLCSDRGLPVVKRAYRRLQGQTALISFAPGSCTARLYNRLNRGYRHMHALCRFFLEHSGPGYEVGDHAMIPFLVDMPRLFELFVAQWLRDRLLPEYEINPQERVEIGESGALTFSIDLVIYSKKDKTVKCVMDTKYKNANAPTQADINQVVTYAVAKGCREAVLIYPSSNIRTFKETIGNITVRTMAFPLKGDLEVAGNRLIEDLNTSFLKYNGSNA